MTLKNYGNLTIPAAHCGIIPEIFNEIDSDSDGENEKDDLLFNENMLNSIEFSESATPSKIKDEVK